MTPQERDLILKVAGRVQQAGPQTKDADAEQLINQQIGSHADSVYLLTQAVIVQEYGLEQAQQRIQALEQELRQARQPQAAAPAAGGSFLGGLFSTPAAGAAAPSAAATAAGAASSVGGDSGSGPGSSRPVPGSAAASAGASAGARRPNTATAGQAAKPASGGGMGDFMRSAAAMAVGVAGGHMLFNGLQGMFGDDAAEVSGAADMAASADEADTDVAPADEAAAAHSGGWGAEQGVTEEALNGDGSEWTDPLPAEGGGGWADNSAVEDVGADSEIDQQGFDDGGFDEDWG